MQLTISFIMSPQLDILTSSIWFTFSKHPVLILHTSCLRSHILPFQDNYLFSLSDNLASSTSTLKQVELLTRKELRTVIVQVCQGCSFTSDKNTRTPKIHLLVGLYFMHCLFLKAFLTLSLFIILYFIHLLEHQWIF